MYYGTDLLSNYMDMKLRAMGTAYVLFSFVSKFCIRAKLFKASFSLVNQEFTESSSKHRIICACYFFFFFFFLLKKRIGGFVLQSLSHFFSEKLH